MNALLPEAAAALAATAFFSLSTALKHRSAGQAPRAADGGARALGRFLVATGRSPFWLGGILADGGGVILQVTALHIGALAVVQPLMITGLVFSLVVNHWIAGTRVSRREVTAGVVLVAALLAFLGLSGASSPVVTGSAQPADHLPALIIGLAAVGLAALCTGLARQIPHGGAAALLGVAAGITYACTAALIKSGSDVALSAGWLALLSSWQLYLVVIAGAVGLVLSQLAFQAGPLRASLPATATVDPLLSIALGVLVYDERLRSGMRFVTGEGICLAVMCGAAIYLSRMSGGDAPPDTVTGPDGVASGYASSASNR